MTNINIHQIYYNEETKHVIDPYFIPLDNCANLRPDWAEYWVIRQFLLNKVLDENAWYGFFSPKFTQKTGLTGERVLKFITSLPANAQVAMFSPFWDVTSYFRSAFEQAEQAHPGFFEVMQAFVDAAGFPADLRSMVTHSQNTVYCNYFVAKPAFWRRWLELGEALFEISESSHLLAEAINNGETAYSHQNKLQFKVFMQERLATLILSSEKWGSFSYSPFDRPYLRPVLPSFKSELIVCDALKQAYCSTQDEYYLNAYLEQRALISSKHNNIAPQYALY
jgi:hypothetical protein